VVPIAHLKSFYAVATARSFTGAASMLSLDVSTVSKHVSALERLLRQPLLERSGGSVAITEPGRHVLRETVALLAHCERIMAIRTGQHGPPRPMPALSPACAQARRDETRQTVRRRPGPGRP
jgi:DNA-binding transcriptional LysR family regulator